MQNPTFMDRLLQATTFTVLLWFAFLCSTDASSVDMFIDHGMAYANETSLPPQEIAYVAPSEWRLMTDGLEVFDNETATEIVDDLYGFSDLEKRDGNRITYAAKVGALAIGAFTIVTQGNAPGNIEDACFDDAGSTAKCVGNSMYYTVVAVLSVMGGAEYINSAAGLRQGLINLVNDLRGIVGGAKRKRAQPCGNNNRNGLIKWGGHYSPNNYGVKLSCDTPCVSFHITNQDTVNKLVNGYVSFIEARSSFFENQFTFYDYNTKQVFVRCHLEAETVATNTCPMGITGGTGCKYEG